MFSLQRKDGTYTWVKIPPCPPHVELVFPPQDEPWPQLLDEIDHMELCHTFGNHYDVVWSTGGFYPPSETHTLNLKSRNSLIFSNIILHI